MRKKKKYTGNKAVRDLVKRHGSLVDAADATGIPKATLSAWMTGFRKPDADNLSAISEKTGLTKAQLRPDIFDEAA